MKQYTYYTLLIGIVTAAHLAKADPALYIGDYNGRLASVDVHSGAVTMIGSMGTPLFDIAFGPDGILYGVDENEFYRINPANASLTPIGLHGIPNAVALGFGSDGTLYSASESTTALYRIDPLTGQSTVLGNIGFRSAGDLAFNGGQLFMSSLQNQLIRIDQNTFAGTVVGNFGVSGVLGLATAADGILYGVAGTRIFSVNPATGAATESADFRLQGLSSGLGAAAVPEPSTCGTLLVGGALFFLVRRTKGSRAV